MRASGKMGIWCLVGLLVAPILATGCGDSDPVREPGAALTREPVKIAIGNLTDKTGVSSPALSVIDMALEDFARYYNEKGLIPGVELEVISYDEQYDPSRDIPGYEWLRQMGADLIWAPLPPMVQTLKSRANEDQFVIFSLTANMDIRDLNGGYVFCLGITPEYEAYTCLKWIAENDPDFPEGRPARIGGASWTDGYSGIWFEAAEAYANAHPDQYEWVGGYMTNFAFAWDAQVQALKDCDYVYVPSPPLNFANEYRSAGYGAKFIGTDVHTPFLGLVDEAGLWEELDGMLFIRCSQWYGEEGPTIGLVNSILEEKHAHDAEEIRKSGSGYIAGTQACLMLEIVKKAVSEVGPENFNSQALYDAATSFRFTLDGIEDFATFDETKRYVQNYYGIYEASASERDIFRVEPEWVEQVTVP